MNNIYKKIVLAVSCVLLFSVAKAQTAPLEDVVNAVRSGKVSGIARYFDNVVPVTINNNLATYSKTQAEMVLKDFFNKNTPNGFEVMNSGSPNKNSTFLIGDLSTANGKYSVYILLKSKDDIFYLQEIRITKE